MHVGTMQTGAALILRCKTAYPPVNNDGARRNKSGKVSFTAVLYLFRSSQRY
jgi:hypothetical protein